MLDNYHFQQSLDPFPCRNFNYSKLTIIALVDFCCERYICFSLYQPLPPYCRPPYRITDTIPEDEIFLRGWGQALAFWANAFYAKTLIEIWPLLSIFRGFWRMKWSILVQLTLQLGIPLNINDNGGQNISQKL